MKSKSAIVLFVAAISLTAIICGLHVRADEAKPPMGVLGVLAPKQAVVVKEVGDRFDLTLLQGQMAGGHEVVEVGADYVVVRDIAGVSDRRIPVTSIRSVVVMRVMGR